jgi:hypothetical protein
VVHAKHERSAGAVAHRAPCSQSHDLKWTASPGAIVLGRNRRSPGLLHCLLC